MRTRSAELASNNSMDPYPEIYIVVVEGVSKKMNLFRNFENFLHST